MNNIFNNTQNIIADNKKAVTEIKGIFEVEKAEIKKLEDERYNLANELRDKIRALENEKYYLEEKYRKQIEHLKEENKNKAIPLREIHSKHKRIMQLIHISKQPKRDLSLKANNRGKEIECIDEPINNEYLHIYVYIYENDKPRNKYSLAMASMSIFDRELIGYNWGSINPYFEDAGQRFFEFNIKDAPTKKELIEYYNKRGANSFWKRAEFEELVKEYEYVLQNCSSVEWQIEYLLWQKTYYENNYSRGTETEEYKTIVKQLKKLQTACPA